MPDTETAEQPATVTAAEFVSELPPVNPAAVNAAVTPAAEPPPDGGTSAVPPPSVERDAKGTPYDPTRHVHTKHPRTGCWMPRRQPRAGAEAPTGAGFVAPDPEPPAPPPPPSEFRIAAEAACSITYAVGMTIGGEEWAPSRDEHTQLLSAWEVYLKTKQVKDIPPGVALTIAMLAYAGPRFTRPKTLTRLQKIGLWWQNWRAKVAGRRTAEAIAKSAPAPEATS